MNSEFRGNIPIPSAYGPPNRNRRHPQMGGNSPCPYVRNAQTQRSGGNCKVTCQTNFELPNGAASAIIQRQGNRWVFEGLAQNEKVQCTRKSSCPSKPDTQQAKVNCGGNECTVNCFEGHSLPDGSTSIKLICKDKKWEPADPNMSFPPNCECKGAHFFIKKIDFTSNDSNCIDCN